MTVPRRVRRPAGAAAFAALLASCTSPPTQGIFLHREDRGAVILRLAEAGPGRIAGDMTLTRVGANGAMHVVAHKLSGTRNGDIVTLADPGGARVTIALSATAARVTVPDGSVMLLDRADEARESALLASLDAEARRTAR